MSSKNKCRQRLRFRVPEDRQSQVLDFFRYIARGTDVTCYGELVRRPGKVILVMEGMNNAAAVASGVLTAFPWANLER